MALYRLKIILLTKVDESVRKSPERGLRLNKNILKAIEYALTAAGLLIGLIFIVLIVRGT